MPYQLRIDPKRYYRQTDQDRKIGVARMLSDCFSLAEVKPGSFSLLRGTLAMPFADTIR